MVHLPPEKRTSRPTGQWVIQIKYSILASAYLDHFCFQLLLVELSMKQALRWRYLHVGILVENVLGISSCWELKEQGWAKEEVGGWVSHTENAGCWCSDTEASASLLGNSGVGLTMQNWNRKARLSWLLIVQSLDLCCPQEGNFPILISAKVSVLRGTQLWKGSP